MNLNEAIATHLMPVEEFDPMMVLSALALLFCILYAASQNLMFTHVNFADMRNYI